MEPCGHNKLRLPDPPWSADYCRVCLLYETDPAYRRLWDAAQNQDDQGGGVRRSLECIHLGRVVNRKGTNCPRQWIRECARHRACTLSQCDGRPDYEPDQ